MESQSLFVVWCSAKVAKCFTEKCGVTQLSNNDKQKISNREYTCTWAKYAVEAS